MEWQTHTTEDKDRKRTLSIAEQLNTRKLIVKLEAWDVATGKIVTHDKIIIDPLDLVGMVYAAEGVK